jgi:hypothetical protein
MKDKASDFEKRYPGRGKEVMYATATKMAKKIAEQAMELQPKTQPQPKEKPLDTSAERQQYSNLRIMQQRQQQLQKQKLNLQKQGKLPLDTAGYEPDGEMVDEARAEEKRGLGSTGAQRQRQKTKIGGIANPATSYSGGQNPQLRGKEGRTKEQRRQASRRYVDQPGGIYAKPETKQGEGKYSAMQSKKRPDLGSRFD